MHARPEGRARLPASGLRIGEEADAQLTVVGGKNGRIRLSQGDLLQIDLALTVDAPAAEARLYSDIGSSGEFHEIALARESPRLFRIHLEAEQAGSFHFALQYTLDGLAWFWLRGDLWQLMVFPRALRDLRLYTLIPNASGPMDEWADVLRRAAELGFNMIHILPLTQQGASQSPYAAANLFALERAYLPQGSTAENLQPLEKLVATAQELRLGLCLDLVLNHVAIDSELVQSCPHWIVADPREKDGLKRNGFIGPDGFHKWNDLALLHYQHPDPKVRQALWSYMEAYAFFWAGFAAATDGMIRLDNLHSTDPAFAAHIIQRLRSAFPKLGILGEFFATQDSTQNFLQHCAVDLLLATTWEHHFAEELRRYFRYIHEAKPYIPWFTPINSHDSGTPAEEFADKRSTQARYILCALLGIGTTGLTQGVEFGLARKINFIGRQPTERPAATGTNFGPMIKRAHELLVRYSAFAQQGNVTFVDHGHVAIIAALRLSNKVGEPHALVVANLDIHHAQTIVLDLQSIELSQSSLTDAFTESTWTHEGHVLQCALEPCGFRVILLRPA